MFRAFGRSGLEVRIREHCRLARLWADRVEAERGWEVLAPVSMSVVCFRHCPPGLSNVDVDAHNQRIVERANASGALYLTHARLRGRIALRIGLGNVLTEERHLRVAWERLQQEAEA